MTKGLLRRATAILAICCFSSGAIAQDVVKVGAIFPMSGGAGPQGQHVTQAIRSMAAIINESGGVNGKHIEIVAKDDESTPAIGISRATELIGENVAVVIEGWSSPVTLAMQPIFMRAGVLDITVISKADAVLDTKTNPLPIRLNSSNTQDGAVIAEYIAKRAKAKKIAFLTENDSYGIGAQESIERELKKLGHAYQVVAVEKFPFAQSDFRVPLTNVRSARPEVTVAINANEGLGMPALIRQARQGRLPGVLVTAVGTVAPSVIKVAGDAANGIIGADIYFPDAAPFADDPANQRFIAKTKALYNYEPDKFMALGALALQVWATAANEQKTFDKEAIAKRIRGGKFEGTVFGEVSFQPDGQLISRHHLFTVNDQKIKLTP